MATLPRYILAPYQAAIILATKCEWPRAYLYRRIGWMSNNILFTLRNSIRRDRLYLTQPEKGQPHVGIEPTYLAWKASILADKLIGQI